jgi:RsiW-degrading membrane proteinase PrsW (M82 family)
LCNFWGKGQHRSSSTHVRICWFSSWVYLNLQHEDYLCPCFVVISSFFFYFILSVLHLLTCVSIIRATSPPTHPWPLGRACSTLLFSDFVEEKTKTIITKTWLFS